MMALRRAEFYFAVRNLLVSSNVLGTELEFERGGFRIEVQFPRSGTGPGRDFSGISYGITAQPYGDARAVDTLKVLLYGDGPPGEDTEASIEHLRKSLHVAEAVVGELIEWSRIYGQSWLGLHGQPPKRIGSHLLGDETGGADYAFSEDVLPCLEGDIINYEFETSIDLTRVRSLRKLLSDDRPSLPVAETLLADALYFMQLNPSDCLRAVLIAAMACEVKVKDTLRKKTPPEFVPLIDLVLENPRDWSMAAQALYDKATKAAFGRSLKDENRELHRDVDKLFQLRNRIAHRGEKPDEEEAKRLVHAGRKAFAWLDKL